MIKFTFRALRSANYRLFFFGQGTSLIGTWMQRIATSWLVYRLTGSPVLLGVSGFASQIPTFLLAAVAGVFADRWNKKNVLLITQVLALLQALVLAFLVISGMIRVWEIIALNVVLGIINAFDIPTRQSFVVEMVENRDDLGNAIALNSSLVNGARLIGPSLTGILITSVGEGICFILNGASYIFIIWALLLMKVKEKRKLEGKNKGVINEFREGFTYIFGSVSIRSIILLLALVSLLGMPYQVLMPIFAKEVLHGGPHTLGFLMGSAGLGAMFAAFFLASKKTGESLRKYIIISAVIFGSGLIAFSFSKNFWVSVFFLLITGFGMMLQMASSNTILQLAVDDDKRGRVMAFYTMAFMGMAPFGSLLAGSLAGLIGAPNTVMLGGILCIAGAYISSKNISHTAVKND
ncbi:MAG: MFS transporter [Elusimicrobia bacterium RIFOXYA2_FULL_40_6]|nr:MAG: MFS transporter [Elusimicrobia bacterium RIFOXYA2_FULL_40_6]